MNWESLLAEVFGFELTFYHSNTEGESSSSRRGYYLFTVGYFWI